MTRELPFTHKGTAEIKQIYDIMNPLIVGNAKDTTHTRHQIFHGLPCQSIDNHFSGDEVLSLIGESGWGGIFTCHHDHLP